MKSDCYCEHFSCEGCVKNDRRFRFEKNEDNMICGGGVIMGNIESCPIRQSGEFQLKPYTLEQLGKVACQQVVERHAKRHNKKKGGRR